MLVSFEFSYQIVLWEKVLINSFIFFVVNSGKTRLDRLWFFKFIVMFT